MNTRIKDAAAPGEAGSGGIVSEARKSVVWNYVYLAMKDGVLSKDEEGLADLLGHLPDKEKEPLVAELDKLAVSVQSDSAGLTSPEAQLIGELATLVTEKPTGRESVVKNLLVLVNDFAGSAGQPTGLSSVHIRAVKLLMGFIKSNSRTSAEIKTAIDKVRQMAIEGAEPAKGKYSGLTDAEVDSIAAQPAPAPPAPKPPAPNTPPPGPPGKLGPPDHSGVSKDLGKTGVRVSGTGQAYGMVVRTPEKDGKWLDKILNKTYFDGTLAELAARDGDKGFRVGATWFRVVPAGSSGADADSENGAGVLAGNRYRVEMALAPNVWTTVKTGSGDSTASIKLTYEWDVGATAAVTGANRPPGLEGHTTTGTFGAYTRLKPFMTLWVTDPVTATQRNPSHFRARTYVPFLLGSLSIGGSASAAGINDSTVVSDEALQIDLRWGKSWGRQVPGAAQSTDDRASDAGSHDSWHSAASDAGSDDSWHSAKSDPVAPGFKLAEAGFVFRMGFTGDLGPVIKAMQDGKPQYAEALAVKMPGGGIKFGAWLFGINQVQNTAHRWAARFRGTHPGRFKRWGARFIERVGDTWQHWGLSLTGSLDVGAQKAVAPPRTGSGPVPSGDGAAAPPPPQYANPGTYEVSTRSAAPSQDPGAAGDSQPMTLRSLSVDEPHAVPGPAGVSGEVADLSGAALPSDVPEEVKNLVNMQGLDLPANDLFDFLSELSDSHELMALVGGATAALTAALAAKQAAAFLQALKSKGKAANLGSLSPEQKDGMVDQVVYRAFERLMEDSGQSAFGKGDGKIQNSKSDLSKGLMQLKGESKSTYFKRLVSMIASKLPGAAKDVLATPSSWASLLGVPTPDAPSSKRGPVSADGSKVPGRAQVEADLADARDTADEVRKLLGDTDGPVSMAPDSDNISVFSRDPVTHDISTTEISIHRDSNTLTYDRKTIDSAGSLKREQGTVAFKADENPSKLIEQISRAKNGEVAKTVSPLDWQERQISAGAQEGDYVVTDKTATPDGGSITNTTDIKAMVPGDVTNGPNAQVAKEISGLSGDDAARLSLNPEGLPVEVVTSTKEAKALDGTTVKSTETRFTQTGPDGSSRTLIRSEVAGGAVEWRTQDESSDGKNLTEVSRTKGTDARSERTAVMQDDGSLKETLVEYADSKSAKDNPDAAVVRTERTTTENADGSRVVVENRMTGDSLANASPGGYASRTEHKEVKSTQAPGKDGVMQTTETSKGTVIENGKESTFEGEKVVSNRSSGDVVESLTSEVTTPDDVTVRSETRAGQTSESVKVDGKFVAAADAPKTPQISSALATLGLARAAHIATLADASGLDSVAPLLGDETKLSADPAERKTQLQAQMDEVASKSMTRVYASRSVAGGAGALSLYGLITGCWMLPGAIKSGNKYGIALASTGVSAGGAQVAEMGVRGAGLMASSTKAISVLGKAASVAGKLAIGLGAAALGLAIPGLVDAIKSGDTKAIVSSSVGLAGGLAAVVAGSAIGGPIGLAVGVVIGGLTIAFMELFDKLFHPGKPISGSNPLAGMSMADRGDTLKNARMLFDHWGELGGSLSKDRLEKLSKEGATPEIKAAAQYFVDHEELINWMDASNGGGGDLNKREATYDGAISKSDLVRFMGYISVPVDVYQTLPPPSQDARLWAVDILDPQTHEQVVDQFGKDGETQGVDEFGDDLGGQGSGDGAAGLPEYANIASGLFDDRTRELLKQRYAGESDADIEKHLTRLKKACAYLVAYPSELRALDSFKKPGQEDGKVGTVDLEMMRQDNQARIDELHAKYPDGMPSFKDMAHENTALGFNNPAIWRPDRFDEPNSERPLSYYKVVLDQFGQIDLDGNGEITWDEMANAREQALQQKQYGLYFSLDYIMRNSADVFTDRGEGKDLHLSKADLALQVGQDRVSPVDEQMVLPASAQNRGLEAATLSQFMEAHPKSGDSVSADDLKTLSAGHWVGQEGQDVSVPEAVRQAALYFTQNPTELAGISTLERGAEGSASFMFITLADLKAAGAGQSAQTDVLKPQQEPPAQRQSESYFDVKGPSAEQQHKFWAFFYQHFDEIETADSVTAPADGRAGFGDLKKAQQKYLDEQNWEGYYAISWILSDFSQTYDADSLMTKDAVKAYAAKSLLTAELDKVDEADGAKDGKFSLDGLEKVRAAHEQEGKPQEAEYMALLIQDYRARTQRLGASLDADEGMKRDNSPADNLISIEGDVRKQVNDYELSEEDKQALQSFLDNSGQIAHYGDQGDIVNTQDFTNLLGQNLQWFGAPTGAPKPVIYAQQPAPEPPQDEEPEVLYGS